MAAWLRRRQGAGHRPLTCSGGDSTIPQRGRDGIWGVAPLHAPIEVSKLRQQSRAVLTFLLCGCALVPIAPVPSELLGCVRPLLRASPAQPSPLRLGNLMSRLANYGAAATVSIESGVSDEQKSSPRLFRRKAGTVALPVRSRKPRASCRPSTPDASPSTHSVWWFRAWTWVLHAPGSRCWFISGRLGGRCRCPPRAAADRQPSRAIRVATVPRMRPFRDGESPRQVD